MPIAAVGQICSTANLQDNLSQCLHLVDEAVKAKADILFLPEAADYIATSTAEGLHLAQAIDTSPFVLGLQNAARKSRIGIHVGVHEPSTTTSTSSSNDAPTKTRNTLIYIDSSGSITNRYHKLHLFDVRLSSGIHLQESASVEAGTAFPIPFPSPVGMIGPAICYDLRFAELGLYLRRRGAEVITFPSAFTVPTGRAHWNTLLRARAIETQTFVVAAAQVGQHNDKRTSYGHSMIVDPWGEVLCELGGEWMGKPELAVAEIDLAALERVRGEMRLVRRTDVYPEI